MVISHEDVLALGSKASVAERGAGSQPDIPLAMAGEGSQNAGNVSFADPRAKERASHLRSFAVYAALDDGEPEWKWYRVDAARWQNDIHE